MLCSICLGNWISEHGHDVTPDLTKMDATIVHHFKSKIVSYRLFEFSTTGFIRLYPHNVPHNLYIFLSLKFKLGIRWLVQVDWWWDETSWDSTEPPEPCISNFITVLIVNKILPNASHWRAMVYRLSRLGPQREVTSPILISGNTKVIVQYSGPLLQRLIPLSVIASISGLFRLWVLLLLSTEDKTAAV